MIRGEGMKSAGGIYFAKGPEFHAKFMGEFMMPRRAELVAMLVASTIQSGVDVTKLEPGQRKDIARGAYRMADDMLIIERETLDERMAEYWDLYMSHSKETDDVMAAVEDSHKDYSLSE